MESGVTTVQLRIGGMSCVNCQNKIEKKLRGTNGVKQVSVDYNTGLAAITYDAAVVSLADITAIIQKLGYEVSESDTRSPQPNRSRAIGVLLIVAALYLIMQRLGFAQIFNNFRLAEAGMGYGMLFVIGLITSVHCIGMCGGINISQCIPAAAGDADGGRLAALRPSFLYNLGRVASYTVIGGIVGAIGSVIDLSGVLKGVVQLIAGVFMMLMGINMLGVFPSLRRFVPRMPKRFADTINAEKGRSKSPLYIGLLNGLMPCGPLQAMQLYALSTGNAVTGAVSMLLFSLGTVPLMFGLGALGSLLSQRFTRRMMTVGAALVIVLGISMFSQGWSLSGFAAAPVLPVSGDSGAKVDTVIEDGVQTVNSTLSPRRYPAITVQVGVPVKWTIDAPQGSINGCNNRIFIPEYGIEHSFTQGENVIEFTPEQTGRFQYSCWMGMIRSTITVVDREVDVVENADDAGVPSEQGNVQYAPAPADYTIPTDALAIAEVADDAGGTYQKVKIALTDEGFSPAVIVLQAGLETEWIIDRSSEKEANSMLIVPVYYAQIPLDASENPMLLYPAESFDFSNGDNSFYGYVKVVDDIENIDLEAVKDEVRAHQALIWPAAHFEAGGANGSEAGCCN